MKRARISNVGLSGIAIAALAFSAMAGNLTFVGVVAGASLPSREHVVPHAYAEKAKDSPSQRRQDPIPLKLWLRPGDVIDSTPVIEVASTNQLQPLVAPVALYPDPLLADVLPASTYPDQITAAAAWVQQNPNPTNAAIAAQPWDPSVQGLVHYPTVLSYMASDIDWTTDL